MRIVAVIFGIALIVLVAQDAFETIVLLRRVTRRVRLAVLFYRTSRFGWISLGRLMQSSARRDAFLGYMGPLSLLALLSFWAVLFVFGFGFIMWGLALPLNAPCQPISFLTYLYLSDTTFFTPGLGDVIPLSGVGRFLVVSEVAFGFIFLALVISYVPVLYQAFSRRELRSSLLDARVGSPPTAVELLRRNGAGMHRKNCARCCTSGRCGAQISWRATSPIPSWPTTYRSMSNNPGWRPSPSSWIPARSS